MSLLSALAHPGLCRWLFRHHVQTPEPLHPPQVMRGPEFIAVQSRPPPRLPVKGPAEAFAIGIRQEQ